MPSGPDPGGHFASDAHRRVMAHLPNPDDDAVPFDVLILERINLDSNTLALFDDVDEVEEVLKDLEADGHAKQLKSGWKNTKEGFDLLTGPPDETAAAAAAPPRLALDPSMGNSNGSS